MKMEKTQSAAGYEYDGGKEHTQLGKDTTEGRRRVTLRRTNWTRVTSWEDRGAEDVDQDNSRLVQEGYILAKD